MPAGSHTHTQHSHTHNQRNRHAKIGEKRAEKIKAVQLSVTTAGEVPRMWMWMGMGMGMGTGLRMWMWRGSFGGGDLSKQDPQGYHLPVAAQMFSSTFTK